MHGRRYLLLIVWIGLVATFGGGSPARGATIGSPQQVGTITSATLDEISGLVASRSVANVLWAHNDSGDSARFFAMSTGGSLLGTFSMSGASAQDWEDIAIGPKPGGGNYLFLGDIGDNSAGRSSITVYRTSEPLATTSATISSSNIRSLKLKYPGGPRDAESMFVDPLSGDLFILTKRLTVPELYTVPATAFDNFSQTLTMTSLGTFPKVPSWATGADVSPDGRFILIRSSNSGTGYVFERGAGQSIAAALQAAGSPFQLGNEAQGEAIGWAADGKSFYTTTEFNNYSSAPIYSYAFSAPPQLPGDYNNDHVVDTSDYVVWRNHFGTDFEMPNETESIGSVTDEDYAVWKTHFGESLGGEELGVGVPEPTSVALVVFASSLLAALAGRVRVRNR